MSSATLTASLVDSTFRMPRFYFQKRNEVRVANKFCLLYYINLNYKFYKFKFINLYNGVHLLQNSSSNA